MPLSHNSATQPPYLTTSRDHVTPTRELITRPYHVIPPRSSITWPNHMTISYDLDRWPDYVTVIWPHHVTRHAWPIRRDPRRDHLPDHLTRSRDCITWCCVTGTTRVNSTPLFSLLAGILESSSILHNPSFPIRLASLASATYVLRFSAPSRIIQPHPRSVRNSWWFILRRFMPQMFRIHLIRAGSVIVRFDLVLPRNT